MQVYTEVCVCKGTHTHTLAQHSTRTHTHVSTLNTCTHAHTHECAHTVLLNSCDMEDFQHEETHHSCIRGQEETGLWEK